MCPESDKVNRQIGVRDFKNVDHSPLPMTGHVTLHILEMLPAWVIHNSGTDNSRKLKTGMSVGHVTISTEDTIKVTMSKV